VAMSKKGKGIIYVNFAIKWQMMQRQKHCLSILPRFLLKFYNLHKVFILFPIVPDKIKKLLVKLTFGESSKKLLVKLSFGDK
jgi:hypothetical protein